MQQHQRQHTRAQSSGASEAADASQSRTQVVQSAGQDFGVDIIIRPTRRCLIAWGVGKAIAVVETQCIGTWQRGAGRRYISEVDWYIAAEGSYKQKYDQFAN